MQSIENKALSRIYGHGRGWCFSQIDFSDLGPRGSIDSALHRLERKGTIRRISRGLYEYPRFSSFLNTIIGPDIEEASRALARKFKWEIIPHGATALYILGVSYQVPSQYVYISNGPNRIFDVSGIELVFQHQETRQTIFQYRESALVVQAMRSLGKHNITSGVMQRIREMFDEQKWKQIIKDTASVASWIHDELKRW